MTAQEAFKGIRQIEGNYGEKFAPVDLHVIWNGLLEQPYAALTHAVGEMKMIWKRMPSTHQLLDAVRNWSTRLDLKANEGEFNEASAHFALTIGFLDGRISETELIRGLYAMSQRYKNPEYAQVAEQREAILREKQAA